MCRPCQYANHEKFSIQTRDIFASNFEKHYDEGALVAIKGKIDEIELPRGIDHVDVIISEWMG